MVYQIEKLNQIKTKDFSEIEQKFINEELKGKIDLKFLIKESEESDNEYGQEVYETLKNEAFHACNNFYEMRELRRLTGSEPTFFIQAAVLPLLCCYELLSFYANREYLLGQTQS